MFTISRKRSHGVEWRVKMDGVHFLHVDKHLRFCKLALSFLMKIVRHAQSTQNRELVIFVQCLKKKVFNFVCGEQKTLYSKGHW